MKGKKVYLAFLSIVLLISVGTGVFTRLSFVHNNDVGKHLSEAGEYQVSFLDNENYVNAYFDNKIDNLQQLRDKSDVVVKVKLTPERTQYLQSIRSKVDVLEVYKAMDIKQGDQIYIYEPNSFNSRSYTSMFGYNIMLPEQEYIFFLRKLKVPEGYQYKRNEAISYLPVSTLFSKYPLESNVATNVIPPDEIKKGVTYDKVKQFDLISVNRKILEKYKLLRKDVFEMK